MYLRWNILVRIDDNGKPGHIIKFLKTIKLDISRAKKIRDLYLPGDTFKYFKGYLEKNCIGNDANEYSCHHWMKSGIVLSAELDERDIDKILKKFKDIKSET